MSKESDFLTVGKLKELLKEMKDDDYILICYPPIDEWHVGMVTSVGFFPSVTAMDSPNGIGFISSSKTNIQDETDYCSRLMWERDKEVQK